MKIAYLLSVYKDPIHLNRLLHALDSDNVHFFIYIDKKSKIEFKLPKLKNITVIKDTIMVHWGGFTQVESTIAFIKEAHAFGKYDYYVLLSGSDYPLRSNNDFFRYLEKNKGREFIELAEMPLNDKTFDRIEYIFLEGSKYGMLTYLYYKINKLIRLSGIKRKYPKEYSQLKLYGGSHWWILTNNCIEYILKYVEENINFSKFYKYTYIPSEMFFHTIIGNSPFMKNVVGALTYTDWKSKKRPLPAEITEEYISILSATSKKNKDQKQYFFARKFFDRSKSVTDIIDKKLRK